MPSLSVIIPALNEEAGIAAVLDQLRALNLDAELLVVDDGSTDHTGDIARAHGARVIRHSHNRGYGASIKDAITAAMADTIVLTDADGTYPVDKIPTLLAEYRGGCDMVVGARQGVEYRGSLFKMPARFIFKLLVEFTTGRRIPDINSGLRIFSRKTVMPLFADLCNTFSFTTTITLVYMLTGKSVCYIPVDYHARIGTSKVRIVRDSLRTLQFIIETMASYNPLKLSLLLCMLLLLGSVVLGVIGDLLNDAMFTLVSILVLTGMFFLFGMGILGHMLRRRQ